MDKSPDAFRTISEVAEDLNLPQHVLRFWETRFSQIKPMKRGGGRRFYRPDDVDLLRGIRSLLYDEGYTIRGVQRILKVQGNRYVIGIGSGEIEVSDPLNAGEELSEKPIEKVEPEITEQTPPKQAISVKDMAEPKSGKGILGRLRNNNKEQPIVDISGAGIDLNEEDRRNLQSTLYELLECKRLLDQVRSN